MAKVEIYTSNWCGYCRRAKMLLDHKQIDYLEISVADEPEKKDEMMARGGRHTVPQIFINDKPIGGCDDLFALEKAGKLDQLIND